MKSIVRVVAVAGAMAGLSVFAQDAEEESAVAEASSEAAAEGSEIAAKPSTSELRNFQLLPSVSQVIGTAGVLLPGASEWTPAEEGRHYPLGAAFRTVGADSRLAVKFGIECSVLASGDSSFGTRAQAIGDKTRAIMLKGGDIKVKLPTGLPEGAFSVDAPGLVVENLAGDSLYRYEKTGDGDLATVRCVTGTLAIRGRHFHILAMRAANEVRIRTSQDMLYTGIYGTSGDYVCKLDQGIVKVTDVTTGESHTEPKFLEWKMSPQTAVRIQRAVPELGKSMVVSVMAFDAAGILKNRCVFAENRHEINSGELAPESKANQAELVKKAAEATSETAAEAETTEVEDEGGEEKAAPADDSSGDDLEF